MQRPSHRPPAPTRTLIPAYRVDLSGNEKQYVNECLDSGWISAQGSFTERFEQAVAALTGARHAVAVTNGTTALHLVLHCLGIGPGDEVIVPTFTFIAPVNMIAYAGATPVFADCRRDDWLIDIDDVARRITPRTKAILPVHLYGNACDMAALMDLASRHGLAIVEDSAQSIGTRFRGRHVGTFGYSGIFSFYGNKTVTTGEGGMVITDDFERAELMRLIRGHGVPPMRNYWHEVLGFNWRMTNICAAIGLAQMERLDAILARKQEIAGRYRRLLAELPVTMPQPLAGTTSTEWVISCLLPAPLDRESVRARMLADGVETRPLFYCAHHMPMYKSNERFPVSEDISARGLSLPSYPGLTDDEVDTVVDALRRAIAVAA